MEPVLFLKFISLNIAPDHLESAILLRFARKEGKNKDIRTLEWHFS